MLKIKNLYKLAFILPVFAGLSLMSNMPNEAQQEIADTQVITVDKTVHDFGTVKEDGGNVSVAFIVTNNTNSPILISRVQASCGCTTPEWTKEPIAPGKTGEVTATYSPKGRPGPFDKTITIYTSGNPDKIVVRIKGTVE